MRPTNFGYSLLLLVFFLNYYIMTIGPRGRLYS